MKVGRGPEGRSPGGSPGLEVCTPLRPGGDPVQDVTWKLGSCNRECARSRYSRQPTRPGPSTHFQPEGDTAFQAPPPNYTGNHKIQGQRELDGHLAKRALPLGIWVSWCGVTQLTVGMSSPEQIPNCVPWAILGGQESRSTVPGFPATRSPCE